MSDFVLNTLPYKTAHPSHHYHLIVPSYLLESTRKNCHYIGNQRYYGKKGRFNGSNGDSCVYQLNVNILNDIGTTPKFTGFTRNLVSNIFKLMPDGGLYFTEWYYDNLSKSKT